MQKEDNLHKILKQILGKIIIIIIKKIIKILSDEILHSIISIKDYGY